MSTNANAEIPAAVPPPSRLSWFRRWRYRWRDRRLSALPDRAFCRQVSLAGWEHLAAAQDQGRGLLIALGENGLPRTAERALRLFAHARPAADQPLAAIAEALAEGAVLFAGPGSPSAGKPNLEAVAEAIPGGARLTIHRL